MNNAELISTIRAEIERLMCPEIQYSMEQLLSLLSTLEESEKPTQEELEKEIDRFEDWMETYNQSDYPTSYTTRDIARHFAQWGAEHLKQ